jgi:hypothetical protein
VLRDNLQSWNEAKVFPSTKYLCLNLMLKIQQLFCQKRVRFLHKKIYVFFPRDPIALEKVQFSDSCSKLKLFCRVFLFHLSSRSVWAPARYRTALAVSGRQKSEKKFELFLFEKIPTLSRSASQQSWL